MKTDEILNFQIGNRIREAREAVGFTQEKLASVLEMSVNHISEIERGISGTSVKTISNICRILHVSCDYIVMGRNTDEKQPIQLIEFYQCLSTDEQELFNRLLKLVIEKSLL